MAIPCPECGRQYDVTLFDYGRTIHCTCGARVGLEIRSTRSPGAEPRFLCDTMVGKLARWLRAIGVDAAFAGEAEDEAVVRRALAEGRVVVTRDRRLPLEWRGVDVLVLESEDPLERLREV
ncbi:MAG: Mut7-C RNAse domain-containing protein, partial [Gemmatimonadota bacterium]|nr:Mut7-C RNAse domain-containing protein [Gemmatimonadota bacterium]